MSDQADHVDRKQKTMPKPENPEDEDMGEDFIEVVELEEGEELQFENEWEDEEGSETGDMIAEGEEPRPEFVPIEGVPTVSPSLMFSEHKGSVFCVASEPVTGAFAISGGEDDKAFVWNTDDGSIKFVCEGHKDSVIQAGFSHDSVYAFSADMSGLIKAWRFADGKEEWSAETSDLKWVRWHPKAHILFAGTEDGSLYMWQIPSGQCKVHQTSGALTTAEIFPDGKRLCFAQETGALTVFDLKDWKSIHTFSAKGAADEVICLDIHWEGVLVASGSVNGSVRVIHSQSKKTLWEIDEPLFSNSTEELRAIEGVVFSKTQPWLAVAGLNGTFCIYDLATQTRRHSGSHAGLNGITKLIWHPTIASLFLGHLNGAVSQWDSLSGTLQNIYKGDQDELLDICVSQDGRKLLTASDNGLLCIFMF